MCGLISATASAADSAFGQPDVILAVDDLPLQVRFVDDVELDDPQGSSSGRQITSAPGTRATGSNQRTLALLVRFCRSSRSPG